MTHSGQKQGRNTAPQQSPAVSRSAMLCSEAREVLVVNRRSFITLLGGATAWPLAARAQQAERMRRIGVLMHAVADDPEMQARMAAFHQGLQEAGWVVGYNVRVDARWSGGDTAHLRNAAAELVALGSEVMLAGAG